MEGGGAASTTDDIVTIYLVPRNAATEQGSATRKRSRQTPDSLLNSLHVLPVGEIQANASKLRECSKYFDACMSGRWTQPKREFCLEVQTDVRFYHDCFARMEFPFTPIESIADCIQLLRVASQIQFDLVIDIGVRYLTGVPWSEDEETQVREFYASGQLASDSSADLSKRLQVPLSGAQRQQSQLNLTEKLLRRSLQLSSTGTHSKIRRESRILFRETFETIGRGKCGELFQIALAIVYEELERLLIAIKKTCLDGLPHASLHTKLVSKFCWLFGALWMANSTQALVELVLKDPDVPPLLQAKFHSLAQICVESKWAKMMRTIFEDVLRGRLFLNASQRLALFHQWVWLLKDDHFEHHSTPCAVLVCSFVLTFPQEEQEAIFGRWLSTLDDPRQDAAYDLTEAHSLWMKHLVAKSTGVGFVHVLHQQEEPYVLLSCRD